jgi:acylphosphatase
MNITAKRINIMKHNHHFMKRVTAYITGNVQRAGYRGKVIDIAIAFGLKGNIQNLQDGRVKVIAEGEENDLERFIRAINIKNSIIYVSFIDSKYSPATGDFEGFFKEVSPGETDSRLDKGIEVMSKMLVSIENINKTLIDMNSNLSGKMDQMNENLGGKMDQMNENLGGKMDQMNENLSGKIDRMNENLSGKMDKSLAKQDRMLEKQDELLVEVKDMNRSLNDKMDRALDKSEIAELKADVSEMKSALKAKGII